jgi:hypothetical protein
MGKVWSHENNSHCDTVWALCTSIFFHVLLVFPLGTASSLDLTIGKETRFDILWLSPSSAPPESPLVSDETSEEPASATLQRQAAEPDELRPEAEAKIESGQPSPDADIDLSEPPRTLAKRMAIRKEMATASAKYTPAAEKSIPFAAPRPILASHPQVQVKVPAPKVEAANASQQAKTAAITAKDRQAPALQPTESASDEGDLPPQHLPQFASGAKNQAAGRPQPAMLETTAHPFAGRRQPAVTMDTTPPLREKLEPKFLAKSPSPPAIQPAPAIKPSLTIKPSPATVSASATQSAPTIKSALDTKPVPATKSAPAPQQTASNKTLPSKAIQEARQTSKPSAIAPADKASSAAPHSLVVAKRSIPATKDISRQSTEQPPEPRGLVITSLHGDLKMVIAGDGSVKLSVVFREYPKSRRNKVLTRAEAHREQKVVPVFAKTRQETREAVIETAREGIYIFSIESEKEEPVKATFTLKIFETGAREKVKAIGTRTVSNKAVLARVLMPDGILWEDDSAFTGSLDDSDSTTKFNAQAGLYWKEYND